MPTMIPRAIRANDAFRDDFKIALSLPVAALDNLVEVLAGAPRVDPQDIDIEGIAKRHGVESKDIETASTVLRYLARRAAATEVGIDPGTEVAGLATDLGMSAERLERWPVLSRILERSTEYQRKLEAWYAFHLEPAYEGSEFEVMLRPRRRDDYELVAGFHWTITYHGPSDETQAFAFNLAEADVEKLRDEASAALERLAQLRASGPLEISPPVSDTP